MKDYSDYAMLGLLAENYTAEETTSTPAFKDLIDFLFEKYPYARGLKDKGYFIGLAVSRVTWNFEEGAKYDVEDILKDIEKCKGIIDKTLSVLQSLHGLKPKEELLTVLKNYEREMKENGYISDNDHIQNLMPALWTIKYKKELCKNKEECTNYLIQIASYCDKIGEWFEENYTSNKKNFVLNLAQQIQEKI